MDQLLQMVGKGGNARLALDFGAAAITLLERDASAPSGFRELGVAEVEAENFSEQITALKEAAVAVDPKAQVELWLPEEQILNTYLGLENAAPWARAATARAAVAERTGLNAADITLDYARTASGAFAVCAVERTIVREASDYARKWGFAPTRVTTRHADGAFGAPPDLDGGRRRAKTVVLGGAGAAVAAAAALVVFLAEQEAAPPSALPDPGPARIALAPDAAAPAQEAQAPLAAETEALVQTAAAPEPVVASARLTAPRAQEEPTIRHGASIAGGPNLAAAPSPAPALLTGAATLDTGDDAAFSAALRATSPRFSPALGDALNAAPLADAAYATRIALAAPPLEFSASRGAALRVEDDSPADPSLDTPLPLNDAVELSGVPGAPSSPQGFDVAALGQAPLALRSDEIALDEALGAPPQEDPEADAGSAEDVEAVEEAEAEEAAPLVPARLPEQAAADDPEAFAAAEAAADEAEAAAEGPGPGSVAAAPAPGKRPDALDFTPGPGSVAEAPSAAKRPKSIKPRPVAVARNTSSAKTVRAPSRARPSGPGLANAATLRGAIQLDQTSLLGVFGTAKNRRALLRMSDGRMRRVAQGEVIDGWVVSRIDATSMRMTRGGEVRNLQLIR